MLAVMSNSQFHKIHLWRDWASTLTIIHTEKTLTHEQTTQAWTYSTDPNSKDDKMLTFIEIQTQVQSFVAAGIPVYQLAQTILCIKNIFSYLNWQSRLVDQSKSRWKCKIMMGGQSKFGPQKVQYLKTRCSDPHLNPVSGHGDKPVIQM